MQHLPLTRMLLVLLWRCRCCSSTTPELLRTSPRFWPPWSCQCSILHIFIWFPVRLLMGDFSHTAVPCLSGTLTCCGPIIFRISHLHLEPSDTADGESLQITMPVMERTLAIVVQPFFGPPTHCLAPRDTADRRFLHCHDAQHSVGVWMLFDYLQQHLAAGNHAAVRFLGQSCQSWT